MIVTRIIIVEDYRSTNVLYIGRVWLSREKITVPSIIVFFFVRLLSKQNFLEELYLRSGLNVLFA